MTVSPAAPDLPDVPQSTLFAGADAIEEENLGNFGEYFDNPPPAPGASASEVEPPASENPPSDTGQQGLDGAATDPAPADPAPQDTAAGSEPVVDPQQAEPAPDAGAAPEAGETPEQVEGQGASEGTVPSYRLAQEAARRRQAEEYAREMERRLQAAEAAAQQQVQPQVPPVSTEQPAQAAAAPEPFDLGDDPKQMFDKVLDGDLDKATQLFTEMMQKTAANQQPAQQPPANIPTPEDMKAVVEQQVHEMQRRNEELAVIDTLEKTYDVFDPASDKFNKDLVDETLLLKDTYVSQKYTPAEAMQRASAMVLHMNGIASAQPTARANPAAVPSTAAVKRNVDALNAQPPAMPAGAQQQGTPEIDITKLTEEEFDALPEATVARMRGDLG